MWGGRGGGLGCVSNVGGWVMWGVGVGGWGV